MNEEKGKDTVYVDVDDDITAVIEKVKGSESNIVALVLPKKATALHSLVNIRLLKKTTKDAGKNVVLVTSESAVLPLAGAAGVYVATTASSKPKIPPVPEIQKDEIASSVQVDDIDKTKTIEEAESSVVSDKPKKTPRIPNFEKFRKHIIIGVGVFILLLFAWWFAVTRAPKAKVVITTNASSISTSFVLIADPEATEVDIEKGIVPAKTVSVDKTEKQTAPATGEKDLGAKAKGSVTVSNCKKDNSTATISIGEKLISNGKSYESQSAVTLGAANFDGGGNCKPSGEHVKTILIVADSQGEGFNLGAGESFTVEGQSSEVSGVGSAITGGSSKIAKVVSKQDVDNAKAKLTISDDNVRDELKQQLEADGYFVIPETLMKENEKETASPKVDQEAENVEVTYSATFKLTGVKREDVDKIIEKNLEGEIENEKQQILDDGLETASYTILASTDKTIKINTSTLVKIGAFINEEQIKNEIAGKKSGESENIIKGRPGVVDVRVSYSPFWVNITPKKTNRINIEIIETAEE
ncbi:MAG: hypothetical protein M3P98_04035 [bacterium]|nr:hypothetical protein [bacterium]